VCFSFSSSYAIVNELVIVSMVSLSAYAMHKLYLLTKLLACSQCVLTRVCILVSILLLLSPQQVCEVLACYLAYLISLNYSVIVNKLTRKNNISIIIAISLTQQTKSEENTCNVWLSVLHSSISWFRLFSVKIFEIFFFQEEILSNNGKNGNTSM